MDGNKRLALGGLIAFYGMHGYRLVFSNDAAYDVIMAIAAGELDDVDAIASVLEQAIKVRE